MLANLRLPLARRRPCLLIGLALAALTAVPAAGQTPKPSPTPNPGPILGQDEIDVQSRTSVILGSGARALGMGGAGLSLAGTGDIDVTNPAGNSHITRAMISLDGIYEGFSASDGRSSAYLSRTSFSGAALALPIAPSSGVVSKVTSTSPATVTDWVEVLLRGAQAVSL